MRMKQSHDIPLRIAHTITKCLFLISNLSFKYFQNVIGELYEVDDKKLLFLEKMERLYRQDKIKVLIYETNPDDANMDHYQSKEVECLCYLFDNYKEKLLDLPFDEVYDPNGNPRHELNPQKIPLTEENLKKIRKYLEGEVIEDMDKQIARDDILKAKTSI